MIDDQLSTINFVHQSHIYKLLTPNFSTVPTSQREQKEYFVKPNMQ
jgi:hypothetical protein